jgi:hypothetical protein
VGNNREINRELLFLVPDPARFDQKLHIKSSGLRVISLLLDNREIPGRNREFLFPEQGKSGREPAQRVSGRTMPESWHSRAPD